MSEPITLPCGCQFNETTVLAMCGRHVMELHRKNATREAKYREYVNAISLACAQASSVVRRGGDHG